MSRVTMYRAVHGGALFTMDQLISAGWSKEQVKTFLVAEIHVVPQAVAPVIDWSKAPEDATHGRVTTVGVDFYKRILGEWVYMNRLLQWERAYGTSESNCEERPIAPTPAALRNKACDEMFGVILKLPEGRRHNRSDIIEALYDAGYRKP